MGAREDILAIPDELLRSGKVTEATLVRMDFATGQRRFWTGWGDLEVGGEVWQGTGDVISISSLGASFNLSAVPLEFKLAATEEYLALIKGASSVYQGRAVTVYQLLFVTQQAVASDGAEWEPGVATEPWQPIGAPYAIFTGTMRRLNVRFAGLDEASMTLKCEGLFVRRSAPAHGFWTDRDQQARHAGDKGCELVAKYRDYNPRWI